MKKELKYKDVKDHKFIDLFLTIICIGLIIYGVLNFNNKKETKKEIKKEEISDELKLDLESRVVFFEARNEIYTGKDIENMKNGILVEQLSDEVKLALTVRLTAVTNNYINIEDLNKTFKKIFGDQKYNNISFNYDNKKYLYNEKENRYDISDIKEVESEYEKINYIDFNITDDTIIMKEFVVYLKENKSYTLLDTKLDVFIDSKNIKDNLDKLKYYEYEFIKDENNYILNKITLK